jgi:hypothetical protein
MKRTTIEKPSAFPEILKAERALAECRDELVLRGRSEYPDTRFFTAFDDLILAVRNAAQNATAPDLHRLQDAVRELQHVIAIRRELHNSDQKYGPLFWRRVDLLAAAVAATSRPPRPPAIESPRQLQKALNKPGDPPDRWLNHIHNVWPHVPTVELIAILYEREPDLDPAEHPDVIRFHREQEIRPLVDLGTLIGAAAEIEHRRAREAATTSA